MKFRKVITLLLASLFILGVSLPALAADDVTDIVVWTKDRHDQEFMTALVEKFNAENPDINVIYEMYTDNYNQVIEIASSTNELPSIMVLNGDSQSKLLYQRNQIAYLDEYLTDDMREIFDSSMFIEGRNMFEGKIFTLPATGTTLRLVYNQDIFDRVGISGPPKTLDEMVEYSIKITQELGNEGIYGFALPMANPMSGFQRGVNVMPQLDGGTDFQGFNFVTGTYDFSAWKPYVEALGKIWAADAAFPGCESLNIDPLRTQFADGKIAMYMTYNHSEVGVYTQQFPTEINWQYGQLPNVSGEIIGSQRLNAGSWYMMTTNCPDFEKGFRVLQAFYDLDNMVAYYEQGYGVSVIPAVIEKAKTPEAIEKVPYMGIQATDKIWPIEPQGVVPEGNDWGAAFSEYIFGVNTDLDGIVTDLNTRYQAAYEKSIADGLNTQIQYPNFKADDPANTAK